MTAPGSTVPPDEPGGEGSGPSEARPWARRVAEAFSTESARRFVKDLSLIGVSFGLAKVIAGVTQIIAGRWLGPAEFGVAALGLSFATFLGQMLLFGLTFSMLRYGSASTRPSREISTCGLLILPIATAGILLAAAFRPALEGLFRLPSHVYWVSLAFAAAYGLNIVATTVYQILGRFRARGLNEVAISLLLTILFFVFYFGVGGSAVSYLYAYVAATLVAGVVWLAAVRDQFRPGEFDRSSLPVLFSFALYNLACNIGFFMIAHVQRFIVQEFFDDAKVGLLAAYTSGSIMLAQYASSAFVTVFFPKAARSSNRGQLWNRTLKAALAGILPVAAVFTVAQGLIILLMGEKYPFDWLQVGVAGLAAGLMCSVTALGTIAGTEGIRGARLGLAISLLLGAVNVTLSVLLIPRLEVLGALLSIGLTYLVGLFWIVAVGKRYV